MSNFDKLYSGLRKEADNRRFFVEQAEDFITFKKMAAGPQSSESGGTPLEDQPQPHAPTHCPGCAKVRGDCSCEEAIKEAFVGGAAVANVVNRGKALVMNTARSAQATIPKAQQAVKSVATPMARGGGIGAAGGAAYGAATAKPGESRLRRAVIGAGVGGALGAGVGAARGVIKNRAAAVKTVAAQDAASAASSKMNVPSELMSPEHQLKRGKIMPNAPQMESALPKQGPRRMAQFYGLPVEMKVASEKPWPHSGTRSADVVLGGAAGIVAGSAYDVGKEVQNIIRHGWKNTYGPGIKGKLVGAGLGLLAGLAGHQFRNKTGGMPHDEFERRFMKGMDPAKKAEFKKKYLTKKAHLPVNPTSADSFVNARVGELSAMSKEAGVGNVARKGIRLIADSPYASGAAIWGGAGAAAGAARAPAGQRLRGAVRGGITGGIGGLAATGISKSLAKVAEDGTNTGMHDIKGRAADKHPVSETPSFSDEALSVIGTMQKKYRDARKMRSEIVAGKKPRKVSQPLPIPPNLDKIAGVSALIPKQFKDVRALPIIGLGAAALGTLNYLGSRPKSGLGGKSSREVDLQAAVKTNKLKATEDDGLPTRLSHRMKEFQSGLATDFRKSPVAAAGIGALVGAGFGATIAKILGVR